MMFSERESEASEAFQLWADAHPGNNPERLRGSWSAYAAFSAGFTFGVKAGMERGDYFEGLEEGIKIGRAEQTLGGDSEQG